MTNKTYRMILDGLDSRSLRCNDIADIKKVLGCIQNPLLWEITLCYEENDKPGKRIACKGVHEPIDKLLLDILQLEWDDEVIALGGSC